MIQINLLPDVVLARRRYAQGKRLAMYALAAWAAFLIVLTVLSFGYRAWQGMRVDRSADKITELRADVNSEDNVKFREEALQVQASLGAIGSLFANQRSAMEFIESVRALVPVTGVRIQDLGLNQDNTVTIAGDSLSYSDLGKFVLTLKESSNNTDKPSFSNVVLVGATIGSANSVDFTISAMYTPVGGAR